MQADAEAQAKYPTDAQACTSDAQADTGGEAQEASGHQAIAKASEVYIEILPVQVIPFRTWTGFI